MNDYYETHSELLTQLVDGEISAEQSEQLFASLSMDKELRMEYQSHIAIKETVAKDIEAFTPPMETTNAIFAKLGYASPTGTNIPKVVTPLSLMMKRAVAPAMLCVLAFFGIINYSDLFFDNDEAIANTNINVAKSEMPISANSNSNIINTTSSSISNKELNQPKLNKKIAIIESSENEEKTTLASNSISNSVEVPTENNSNFVETVNNKISLPIAMAQTVQQNNNISLYSIGNEFSNISFFSNNFNSNSSNNFSIYLRGFSDLNNGNSIFTASSNIMNMTLGFMIPLKNDFSFGIEAGVHSFMRFSTNAENQISNTAEQSSVFWIAANARYDVMPMSVWDVNPYLQLSAGGSTLGFIAKSGLGLQYQPINSSFGVSVGYEYSNIWYSLSPDNAEKINFTTNNSGIIFGLNYKF